MELTDTQREAVAGWFAAGASLDEIQKRIKAEFGVHLTYLDVRLLVAELPQPEVRTEELNRTHTYERARVKQRRVVVPSIHIDVLIHLVEIDAKVHGATGGIKRENLCWFL